MSKNKQQNHAVPGYVYLIYDPAVQLYKIGLSRSPATRLRYLKQSYGTQLKLLQIAWTFNMLFVEQSLHKQFKLVRTYRGKIDGGTEWFDFDWWVVPYAKASLLGKCWAVNSCYVLGAIALISLIIVLILGVV
ncbi:GIY-YIG nuclease family protein [Microcoleus sp. herbarium7]|uniref:GIY-YIG nuclease family protein n=1 Tax=Microcoleus sp. herbarium7 TaxID=3055435 RepID=UPI002FD3F71B